MQLLKQNTAFTTIVGPILDPDGLEYAGAVIGDLSISKNGTEAAMAAGATLTFASNGHYTLVGIAGNADTLGRVDIRCNKAGHQMPRKEFEVIPGVIFDSVVLGTDKLQVDVVQSTGVDADFLGLFRASLRGDGTVPDLVNLLALINSGGGGYDNANAPTNSAGVDTLLARLTNARAGYLDNLNIGANVASGAAVSAVGGAVAGLPTAVQIRDAIFARAFSAAYNSLTFDEMVKVIASALAGVTTGMGGSTGKFRNLANSADVISAGIDGTNRTSVTLTP